MDTIFPGCASWQTRIPRGPYLTTTRSSSVPNTNCSGRCLFALTSPVWQRIGGFCTEYTGYGGEDTDYAQKAAAEKITMRWVGGAHAFHQFHPISEPPIEHLADIVANAALFHRRWGWWPM